MPKKRILWSLDRCKESAKPYRTVKEWCNSVPSAYNAASREGWISECCAHMDKGDSKPHGYWTLPRCQEEAAKYATRADWRRGCNASYLAAHRKGWIEKCCGHMEAKQPITLDRCLQNARQYETRDQWREASPAMAATARKRGWLTKCCEHMTKKTVTRKSKRTAAPKTPKRRWTLAGCKESAAGYQARYQWFRFVPGAYRAAMRNGWLEECCAHMPKREKKPFGRKTQAKHSRIKEPAVKKQAKNPPVLDGIDDVEIAPVFVPRESPGNGLAARRAIDKLLLDRKLKEDSLVADVWD